MFSCIKFTRSTIFRESYATFVLAHGYLLCGCTYGFSGIIIPQIQFLSPLAQSWIGSIPNFVSFIFTFLIVYLMGKLGRKQNLNLIFFLYIVGWCSLIFAFNTLTICLCFVAIGYATATVIPVASSYIVETCRTKNRGMFLSIDTLCIAIGSSIDYIIGSFLSWKVVAIVIALISLSGFIQSLILPETKYWHLLTGNEKAAKAAISWFDPKLSQLQIDLEAKKIIASMNESVESLNYKMIKFLKGFAVRKYRKPLAIVIILPLIRSACGIPIATSYPVEFFQDLRTPYSSRTLSILFGILQSVGCLCNLFLFRYFKRKTLFYSYSVIMLATLAATLIYKFISIASNTEPFPIIPVACMLLYVSAAGTGFMTSLTIISAEAQYPYFRAEAMCIFVFALNVSSFLCLYVFPLVQNTVSMGIILGFFVVIVLLGIVMVFWLTTETSELEFHETGRIEEKCRL